MTKYIVMYRFDLGSMGKSEWHVYKECDDMLEAKKAVKMIRIYIGGYKGGNVKIEKKEA